ncbi:adenosylcobinamide-phosphate synthase CbiB [Merismopedia glauca]|uniref:Cobalamin biosynthesis protein CobD n=1 Tax=Merismopedia glauca CCAP 1448/3 TaxID=1296344 RepID=A0A2T1C6P0_9CYAN|nr:adenosylcobinamide-phosphate synthase CbiB [Merismopedia glauca]PSB03942.1 cobalamin biosynthesis protein [Merismopedia glauca CCAP 1448/3]
MGSGYIYVLILAALIDFALADPQNWLHPVQVMGKLISFFSEMAIKYFQQPKLRRLCGVALGILLIGGSALVGWGVEQLCRQLPLVIGVVAESVILASCFAGRGLRLAAIDVLTPLEQGNISAARQKLSLYVGRDPENLSESEILRAVLETVTENAVDGVMAPLFYAVVGGLPLALAYKAASTLDSMIGYRNEPYTDLGWFSARLEDYLTWLPCRLTVATLGLMTGKSKLVWSLCDRDARKDPSPNSGWSECSYAAILGVQLGGTNWYQGTPKSKPLLGDALFPITPSSIFEALRLTRYCFLTWLAIGIATLLAFRRFIP